MLGKKAHLVEDDHSSMRLKHLFDLLCILLGNTLLEHLRERLDKLFGLNTKQIAVRKKNFYTSEKEGKKTEKGSGQRTRTSMRVRFGTIALTSLMIFGLAPASNDSSFTLNIVFSFGLAASSTTSSAPAAPAPEGTAAPVAGSAISWIFRRV